MPSLLRLRRVISVWSEWAGPASGTFNPIICRCRLWKRFVFLRCPRTICVLIYRLANVTAYRNLLRNGTFKSSSTGDIILLFWMWWFRTQQCEGKNGRQARRFQTVCVVSPWNFVAEMSKVIINFCWTHTKAFPNEPIFIYLLLGYFSSTTLFFCAELVLRL